MIFYILMKFFINAVELIAMAFIVAELNVCCTMAIDAPSHAQISKLLHLVHLLDLTVAGLTLHPAYLNMLGVVEINQVREAMDPYPFNWFRF